MDAEQFELVRQSVRQFIRAEVLPLEAEIDESDEIPSRIRDAAARMGLFGFAIPEEFGGLGFGMVEDVRLAFEMGYTTPAFRSMFSSNNGLAGQVLVWQGTPEQQRRYLPKISSGEFTAAFGLTEPEAGSDPHSMKTTAVADGDGYVITGSKRFITNAPVADIFVVFAKTDNEAPHGEGISAFLVERGTPGLMVGPRDKKMGQHGAWTSEIFFDGMRVGRDALVGGEEGRGFNWAMRSLSRGRLHIAAICVGMAQRLLEESARYASEREQFGQPIGAFQLVQGLLADSQTELYAGKTLVLDAAGKFESGDETRIGPSCAKYFCSEMVGRIADRAVQIFGGSGYMRGTLVERMYRDARVFRLYEGTSQIQQVIIGRHLVKSGPLAV